MWEIRNHDLKGYHGNYSNYVEQNRLEKDQH
ncbi:MAG: hypothetical protein GX981_03060 [Tissierellia bacterium]|nr:hypothetical protein [Tissierellia bacterium]